MNAGLERIKAIFLEAIEAHSPSEWEAYLDEACGGDELLRRNVELLLDAHRSGASLLDQGAIVATVERAISEREGSIIGPYKLLQQIGEGGFGVVYMADQTDPIRRQVALKIVKPGMDTRQVIARFEAERQALALMDHPNIARVLDAGATETGRPYFVMELVRGVPITQYCDQNQLSAPHRLELFSLVCEAIQHAHQKGIIHRDIKPSNVMITLHDGKPVPKVIDFGVSKALNQRLTERTLFTAYGQMVGTPQYMSPEQAEMSGLDVDTRSDVYSLGVLLYELLTGRPPLDFERLRGIGYAEMQRIIREEEPPKPSTRLSTLGDELTVVARHRSIDPSKLSRLVRGDLDWIVMKSLEKDRGRRYQAARDLAADLQRFLRGDAVEACPPSTAYKLRKFVRRNRGPVFAAAAIVLALIAGIVGTTVGLIRATDAQTVALDAAEVARQRLVEIQRQEAATEEARREAEDARAVAEDRANEASRNLARVKVALRQTESVRLAAQSASVLPGNPGLALLLAVEGSRRAAARTATHNNPLLAALNACRERRAIRGPNGPVEDAFLNPHVAFTSVCFSHDGRTVAAASRRFTRDRRGQSLTWEDKAVRLTDVATGDVVAQFRLPGVSVHSIEFSPDDRTVLTTFEGASLIRFADGEQCIYSDHTARIWDARTGEERVVLKGHADRVITAHFSSDGSRVLTASWDKTARLWDARTGETLTVIEADPFSLASALFSPDDRLVLAISSGGMAFSKADPSVVLRGQPDPQPEIDPATDSGRDVVEATSLLNISSGGRRFSSGREYTAARLWDASSGKLTHVLGQPVEAEEKVIEQDSAADTATRSQLSLQQTKDAPEKPLFEHPTEETISACFRPDGRYVATGSWLGQVTIWEVATGKPVRHWMHARKRIDSIAYSADGSRLLLVCHDSEPVSGKPLDEVGVCDAESGRDLVRWADFPAGVRSAEFSPDGRRVLILPGNEQRQGESSSHRAVRGELVLAVPEDRAVHVRDAAPGGSVVVLKGHDANVTSAQFAPDGRQMASASEDGTVRLWEVSDHSNAAIELAGHSSAVGLAELSPDGRLAMTAYALRHDVIGASGGDKSARIWDSQTGELLHVLEDRRLRGVPVKDRILGAVRHAEFSRDGRWLLTVTQDSNVRRWIDEASNESDQPPGMTVAKLGSGADVTFKPVRVWNVATGKQLLALEGFSAGVRYASLSPDASRIVTLTDNAFKHVLLDANDEYRGEGERSPWPDAAVQVWDAKTGKQLAELLGKDNDVSSTQWSPDGKWLLTAGYVAAGNRFAIQLWDTDNLRPQLELAAKDHARPEVVTFSPDGGRLLILSNHYRRGALADIWDVATGAKVSSIRVRVGRIYDAAFSPNGNQIVTAGDDWTARVWDTATGEQLRILGGHEDTVRTARVSPDGKWIVTASDDSTARIWDAATGSEFLTLAGHRGPVYSAVFSPDSQSIVTGSGDGTARIWPVDPLPLALPRLPRDFTDEERVRFHITAEEGP